MTALFVASLMCKVECSSVFHKCTSCLTKDKCRNFLTDPRAGAPAGSSSGAHVPGVVVPRSGRLRESHQIRGAKRSG